MKDVERKNGKKRRKTSEVEERHQMPSRVKWRMNFLDSWNSCEKEENGSVEGVSEGFG